MTPVQRAWVDAFWEQVDRESARPLTFDGHAFDGMPREMLEVVVVSLVIQLQEAHELLDLMVEASEARRH